MHASLQLAPIRRRAGTTTLIRGSRNFSGEEAEAGIPALYGHASVSAVKYLSKTEKFARARLNDIRCKTSLANPLRHAKQGPGAREGFVDE